MNVHIPVVELILQHHSHVGIKSIIDALGDSFFGDTLKYFNPTAISLPTEVKGSLADSAAVGNFQHLCALFGSNKGNNWLRQVHVLSCVRPLTSRELGIVLAELSLLDYAIALSHYRYGLICAFHSDSVIGRSLRVYGEWAQNEIDFLCTFISQGDVVLDCGSFIGTHSVPFMKAVGPTGLLIAIEASQIAFMVSLFNILLTSEIHSLFLINACAGEFCGDLVVPCHSAEAEHNPGSMAYVALNQKCKTDKSLTESTVATLAIDALFLERLDVVKLDVEGSEIAVLKGMEATVKAFRPTIWAEVLKLSSLLELIEWSRLFGYHAYGYIVDAYNPDNYKALNSDIWAGGRELSCLLIDPSSRPLHFEYAKSSGKLVSLLDLDQMTRFLCQKTQYVSRGPVYSGCNIL